MSNSTEYIVDNNHLIFIPCSRIDNVTIRDVAKSYEDAYNANNIEFITFDMKKVNYMSSIALRFILAIVKEFSTDNIEIINASQLVKDILKITGFTDILKVKEVGDE